MKGQSVGTVFSRKLNCLLRDVFLGLSRSLFSSCKPSDRKVASSQRKVEGNMKQLCENCTKKWCWSILTVKLWNTTENNYHAQLKCPSHAHIQPKKIIEPSFHRPSWHLRSQGIDLNLASAEQRAAIFWGKGTSGRASAWLIWRGVGESFGSQLLNVLCVVIPAITSSVSLGRH